MQAHRWVSYIYRYKGRERLENAGFIKAQKGKDNAKDIVRFQIGIRLYKIKPCKCRLYLLLDETRIYPVKTFAVPEKEKGTISVSAELSWTLSSVWSEISDCAGLYFVCEDGDVLAGLWKTCTLQENMELVPGIKKQQKQQEQQESQEKQELQKQQEPQEKQELQKQQEPQEQQEPHKQQVHGLSSVQESASESCMQQFVHGERAQNTARKPEKAQSSGDICRRMLDTYPKLPLFADSHLLECVKIVPQDIGRLPIANWKLGTNSFVTHGYYHYRYLMLGRVQLDKGERLVVGIPGVFTNKERYFARMFGFHIFVPAQRTEYLLGRFGYWVLEIVTE